MNIGERNLNAVWAGDKFGMNAVWAGDKFGMNTVWAGDKFGMKTGEIPGQFNVGQV